MKRMKDRFYVKDVAALAGCCSKTIRTLTDLGLIPCQRNYVGWRIFSDPITTAEQVRALLTGEQITGQDDLTSRGSDE